MTDIMSDPIWSVVEDMLDNAKGMYWDGCHKIYLAMDDEERATMIGYGYDHHEPNLDELKRWFETSCGLRFVNAVFHNEQDSNKGFVGLIPQFYFEDMEADEEDEDDDPEEPS